MTSKLLMFIISISIVQLCFSQERLTIKSKSIGFSSQTEIDNSRPSTIDGSFGRLIQINVWYPTQVEKTNPRMNFSDYLRTRNEEMSVNNRETYKQTVDDYFKWPISQGADKSILDSMLTSGLSMKALKNADFKPGKYPVVLLIHGSAVDFAFLGESLAEQGYIAINVPVKGYRQLALDINSVGMETEIRDFEYALSVLLKNNYLDLTNIAVLGFSFGGQSALGLACRNPNIKTVISYDGGIGDRFGARLIKENSFCSIENVSTSILHIYDDSYSGKYLDKIMSFVYSDRTFIGLKKIAHWHFTSFGYLASTFPDLFDREKFSKDGYDTIVEITIDYLNVKLKNPVAPHNLDNNKFKLISKIENFEPVKLD